MIREREGNIGVWCGTREGGQYRGVVWYERGSESRETAGDYKGSEACLETGWSLWGNT